MLSDRIKVAATFVFVFDDTTSRLWCFQLDEAIVVDPSLDLFGGCELLLEGHRVLTVLVIISVLAVLINHVVFIDLLIHMDTDRRMSLSLLARSAMRRVVIDFWSFRLVAHAGVSTLLFQHLCALALISTTLMADEIGCLEDVLTTDYNLTELAGRDAGSFIQASIIVIHFMLELILAILTPINRATVHMWCAD